MPDSTYDLVTSLISGRTEGRERDRELLRFSQELGWSPSDQIDSPGSRHFATCHLVVEHGLQNSAVLSFLNRDFSSLSVGEQQSLLGISYNNLVDWQLVIESDFVSYIYNRSRNRSTPYEVVEKYSFDRTDFYKLRREAFEQIAGYSRTPNVPSLDLALVRTISRWKKILSVEFDNRLDNREFSALFNAVIFARAVEDYAKRRDPARSAPTLVDRVDSGLNIRNSVELSLQELTGQSLPTYLVDLERLRTFDHLLPRDAAALFADFYQSRYEHFYEYDFAIMSKHALSRIYEHYVSILRVPESYQATLFPEVPDEERDKASGNIYTPEFIARFFGRFLREQIPPSRFRKLDSIDPACGSGIFLRTLLEMQCDITQGLMRSDDIGSAFQNVVGIDIDENACLATSFFSTPSYGAFARDISGIFEYKRRRSLFRVYRLPT